jgi:hypothetical protein
MFAQSFFSIILKSISIGTLSHRDPTVSATLWWDAECMGLDDERLASLKDFRRNGSSENFGRYTDNEDRLLRVCESKQTAS